MTQLRERMIVEVMSDKFMTDGTRSWRGVRASVVSFGDDWVTVDPISTKGGREAFRPSEVREYDFSAVPNLQYGDLCDIRDGAYRRMEYSKEALASTTSVDQMMSLRVKIAQEQGILLALDKLQEAIEKNDESDEAEKEWESLNES